MIARADEAVSPPTDPHITVIVYDVLEHYLRDTVLQNWAAGPPAKKTASAKPTT